MFLAALAAAVDYTTWTDSALDDAYSIAFNANDSTTYTAIALEILAREGTVTGWAENLVGNQFPKYNAIQDSLGYGGFNASTAAPASVATSASNAATAVSDAAKAAGSGVLTGLSSAAWIVGGAAVLAALFAFRK